MLHPDFHNDVPDTGDTAPLALEWLPDKAKERTQGTQWPPEKTAATPMAFQKAVDSLAWKGRQRHMPVGISAIASTGSPTRRQQSSMESIAPPVPE